MSRHHRWRSTGVKRARAQQLRQEQTEAEALLWAQLRNRGLAGYKFRRQHPVCGYIADFCCVEQKVIVEIDGSVHHTVTNSDADAERESVLRAAGYHVIRFPNGQVFNDMASVLRSLHASLSREK